MKYLTVGLRSCVIVLCAVFLAACASPEKVTPEQMIERSRAYWQNLAQDKSELPREMTLEQAVLRALEENLSFREEALKAALATGNRKLASMDMLPRLTARAGYQKRSNLRASVSESVETGRVSLEASTASPKETDTHSFELSWDLLDFGLAWFQARKYGEDALIAEQERRRAVHTVTRDLVFAYERALAYQRLEPDVRELQRLVTQALQQSEEILQRKLRDPVQVLDYRKSLLLVLKRINRLTREMGKAEAELANLLNLPAGLSIKLTESDPLLALDPTHQPLRNWQLMALLHRPEMKQAFYRERRADAGYYERMLELFPSLVTRYGFYYDSNRFLVNNRWEEAGARLSWDLMNLATAPWRLGQGELNQRLAEVRGQLQATTVLSQVAIARQALSDADMSSCISEALSDTDQKKLKLVTAQEVSAVLDRLTLIKAQADNLLLRVEAAMDRAERKRSALRLLVSAGMDIVPDSLPENPADRRQAMQAWWREGMANSLVEHFGQIQTRFPELVAKPVKTEPRQEAQCW